MRLHHAFLDFHCPPLVSLCLNMVFCCYSSSISRVSVRNDASNCKDFSFCLITTLKVNSFELSNILNPIFSTMISDTTMSAAELPDPNVIVLCKWISDLFFFRR